MHSLSAQVSYFSTLIQNNPNYEYVGTYADEAYTGTKSNRPEFVRMMGECKQGKIDGIVTKSLSRFARNTVTLLETVRLLKELHVFMYFEEQNINSMNGDGELLLTILASFAQEESKSVSDNMKWRIRHDFEQGKVHNLKQIYGYKEKEGNIVIQMEQAEVVRYIFEQYASGKGGHVIAKQLNAMQIPAPQSTEWNAKKVRSIVRNEKYTGNALLQKTYSSDYLSKKKCINKGKLPMYYVENTHPKIIDMATFKKAQEILLSRQNKGTKPPVLYPFSGKITCMNCQKHYRRKTTNGCVSWQCTTYIDQGKNACPAKQIPEQTLMETTACVLGLSTFDQQIFLKKVDCILVSGRNQLTYCFKNGERKIVEWQDKRKACAVK